VQDLRYFSLLLTPDSWLLTPDASSTERIPAEMTRRLIGFKRCPIDPLNVGKTFDKSGIMPAKVSFCL
jgi:hypothetical protein